MSDSYKYKKYKQKYLLEKNAQQSGLLQKGGVLPTDIDVITTLLFSGICITRVNNDKPKHAREFRNVVAHWSQYFQKDPEVRFGFKPTQLLINSMNILNTRGQSILYCAYRYLLSDSHTEYSLNDKKYSLELLLNVPGTNITIKNTNGDLPIIGMVWENPNQKFILQELINYISLTNNTLAGTHVYSILENRVNTRPEHNPLS